MEFKNQREMFEYIWKTRPHTSAIDQSPLLPPSHPQHHWQFAHVLGKKAYPGYKLNPDNIMLMTIDQHEKQESFEMFRERLDELKQRYYQDPNIKH